MSRPRGIRTASDRRGSPHGQRDLYQDLNRRVVQQTGRAMEALVPRELGSRFSAEPTMPKGRAASAGRILVVDDESAIRLVCRVNLESAGFKTLEAADGETAFSLASSERPDLILLDIMLPGLDGLEVAERLSAEPETRQIPIIFLTACATAPDELRGHEAGGVGYIAKPFDPVFMTETVATVLTRTRRGERDELRREWEQSISTD